MYKSTILPHRSQKKAYFLFWIDLINQNEIKFISVHPTKLWTKKPALLGGNLYIISKHL